MVQIGFARPDIGTWNVLRIEFVVPTAVAAVDEIHLAEFPEQSVPGFVLRITRAFEEGAGMVGAFGRQDLDVDPARGAVDGGEEVLAAVLIGHLGQVLHIDVHEARFVVLERLGRGDLGRFARHQVRQAGHPVAAQAAVQARARDLVVDEFMGHGEQVIEWQQQEPPQFHHQDLLGRREGGMQGMGPVRGVFDRHARAPLAHRDRAEVVASGEDLGWLGRGLQLTTDRRRGARVFVQIDVHRQRVFRMNGGPRAGVALVAGRDSGRPPGSLRPAPRRAPLEPLGHGREDSSFWVHNHTGRDTYAAILHWSPVMRALIKHKRKSNSKYDEEQDSGRAIVVEEGVAAWIFSRAKELNFIENQEKVTLGILKTIGEFVNGYEVEKCPLKLWEKAILEGYAVFRQLKANQGGWIIGNREQRTIKYMPLGSEK